METFVALCSRVSIRDYSDLSINKALLEKLVDAGRRAPSARAVEPWEFIVITERRTLQMLGQVATNGSFIKNAAAAIVVLCRDTKYYLEDGCAATENILIAAADAGLGACWIAGDKKPYSQEVCRILDVPAGIKLVSLIALGWPKQEKEQLKIRRLEEVIHREKF